MSIITFNGEQLAADSRRSKKVLNPKTGEYERVVVSDAAVKIEEINDPRVIFENQVVLAIARCGNAKMSNKVIEGLKGGLDIVSYYQTVNDEKRKPCSVLIVTPRGVFHFRITPAGTVSVTELPPEPFAMGTGTREAVFLMKTMRLSAEEAAMAVTLAFDCCGGPIQVMERDKWTKALALRKQAPTILARHERLVLLSEAVTKRMGPLIKKAKAQVEVSKVMDKVSKAKPVKKATKKKVTK